jgi:hypothetical protein
MTCFCRCLYLINTCHSSGHSHSPIYVQLSQDFKKKISYSFHIGSYVLFFKPIQWDFWSSGMSYLYNQCLSPIKMLYQTPPWWGVLDTTLWDKVRQWLATGRWYSPVSSTNKTDRHYITEILLKVVLNIITFWYSHICLNR